MLLLLHQHLPLIAPQTLQLLLRDPLCKEETLSLVLLLLLLLLRHPQRMEETLSLVLLLLLLLRHPLRMEETLPLVLLLLLHPLRPHDLHPLLLHMQPAVLGNQPQMPVALLRVLLLLRWLPCWCQCCCCCRLPQQRLVLLRVLLLLHYWLPCCRRLPQQHQQDVPHHCLQLQSL
jgi:hypothetical protein